MQHLYHFSTTQNGRKALNANYVYCVYKSPTMSEWWAWDSSQSLIHLLKEQHLCKLFRTESAFFILKIFQTQFTIYLSTKFVFWWYVIFKEGKLLSTIISRSKSSVSVKIHWWTVIQVTVLQSVLTVTSNMTDIRFVHHLSLLCYQIVSKLICFQCFGTW